jgi:hypothetical protein
MVHFVHQPFVSGIVQKGFYPPFYRWLSALLPMAGILSKEWSGDCCLRLNAV